MKKILLLCSVGAILASFPVLAMTPEFAKMLGVLEESGGGGKTPLKRSNSVEFCEGMPPEDLLQESSSDESSSDENGGALEQLESELEKLSGSPEAAPLLSPIKEKLEELVPGVLKVLDGFGFPREEGREITKEAIHGCLDAYYTRCVTKVTPFWREEVKSGLGRAFSPELIDRRLKEQDEWVSPFARDVDMEAQVERFFSGHPQRGSIQRSFDEFCSHADLENRPPDLLCKMVHAVLFSEQAKRISKEGGVNNRRERLAFGVLSGAFLKYFLSLAGEKVDFDQRADGGPGPLFTTSFALGLRE